MRGFRTQTIGLILCGGLLASTPAFAKGSSASVGRGVPTHMRGHGSVGGDPAFRAVGPGLSAGRNHHRFRGGHSGSRFGERGHWRRAWSGVGGWADGGWGYGGWVDPYAYSVPEADYFGYFTTGGDVTLEEGQPVYHYDRGYPYEWYKGSTPGAPQGGPGTGYGPGRFHCETQWVPEGHGQRQAPVRICRR